MDVDWEVVSQKGPYPGVKQHGKKEYYGLFVTTTFRDKVSGTVKEFTEMVKLQKVMDVEQNKYATKGETV